MVTFQVSKMHIYNAVQIIEQIMYECKNGVILQKCLFSQKEKHWAKNNVN